MLSKQVKYTVAVLTFFDQQKAQLTAIRINEQPTLLTKREINRLGYKFLSIFAKKGQSNLVLVFALVSKGPYYFALYQLLLLKGNQLILHK